MEEAQQLPLKTVEQSADYLAEIVGDEGRAGERLHAGPILRLMYDTAYAVAMRHCEQRPVILRLDRIDLTRSICHMDLVHTEGRLIEVGRSSMVVEVRCFSKSPQERAFNPAHVGFITMVAVDEHGQPDRTIPRLSYDTPAGVEAKALSEHRRAQLAERRQALEWIEGRDQLRPEDVVEPEPVERYEYLRPGDTVVQVKGQLFSPRPHEDGRIKGGDLLQWIERVACHTAQRFTRNQHVVTISINDVLFKLPLHANDRIELTARVTYVRTHTLEVAVDAVVHKMSGEQHALDSIDVLLFNYHRSGMKQRIHTGLLLDASDQDSLRRYLKARTRFYFWKSAPESHLTQSPL